MTFYADLHVHSHYSRATSRDCDLEHFAAWAAKKGVSVVGTGDFTHPGWRRELREKLVPAEPGLFRLRPDLEREVSRTLPASCAAGQTRFLLQVEISTIYKKGERTRKIHQLIFAPDLDAAEAISARLARVGNLASDGRPILGLDSHHLLEMVLETARDAFLVPAHIWTPHFAVLGSRSGFDSLEECFGDLTGHIFAAETGLSSDPPMNWRLSALDRFRLVSNSDAHSPSKLAREACVFASAMDYFAMRQALKSGEGYGGTIEFFPEEGKYHLDGHRACDARLTPEETRAAGGLCPCCSKPVTVGVLHRVEALADRPDGVRPPGAPPFRCLVPLVEILSELLGVGGASKLVGKAYETLIARGGAELQILEALPQEELGRAGGPLLAEAIARLRRGEVIRDAGFDGEYGTIRLFAPAELAKARSKAQLELTDGPSPLAPPASHVVAPARPAKRAQALPPPSATRPSAPAPAGASTEAGLLGGLDEEQRTAVTAEDRLLLIIAGPGTGKTRTLTHRMAWLAATGRAQAREMLAVTFTRRAAAELRERLVALSPATSAEPATVTTFHGLGLTLVREQAARLGFSGPPRVLDESARRELLGAACGLGASKAARLAEAISRSKRGGEWGLGDEGSQQREAYERALRRESAVDFDDLVGLPVRLLAQQPEVAAAYRARFPWVFVDEFQDVDALQLQLVRQLFAADGPGGLCVIGDPDQSIYGFRGAEARAFALLQAAHPEGRELRLGRNYRSSAAIVTAALQAIAPATLVPDRALAASGSGLAQVSLHEATSERAEAEFVVRTIEEQLGGHTFFSIDSRRSKASDESDHSFADFAILYRTEAQAGPLCEALARSGMPFECRSHRRVAEQAYLGSLSQALAEEAPGSLEERVARALAALSPLAGDTEGLAAAELESFRACVQRALGRAQGDASALLEELTLACDADSFEPGAERISLMTLHAAKGLEFRVVFVVGCEDGLLPLRFGARACYEAEERRLFFVGLTRARERLVLTHARSRLWRGTARDCAASPFLADIDEALLARLAAAQSARRRGERQLPLF
jgi:DNA helicase II / ATP-dependent DNA helicase PcrA